MLKLTEIEYNILMQALDTARALNSEGDFVDPYSEFAEVYTEELIAAMIPTIISKLIDNGFTYS